MAIVTGSSPRLANRYFGDFLQLFPELRLLLSKVNNRTSSGYERFPFVVTKCLLQVCVWQFIWGFVCLMTWTQCFSSLLFFIYRKSKKVINDALWHSFFQCFIFVTSQNSQNPMHWAARCGNVSILKALIDKGSELNAQDEVENHACVSCTSYNSMQYTLCFLE